MRTHTPYHHLANPHPQQLQITPEEYRAAREELRSIDARPIKKVAEAKARKQKRLRMRLDKVGAGGWGLGLGQQTSRGCESAGNCSPQALGAGRGEC